ncbi:hypothetical protein Q5752_005439 [Cryptotrichosporon argae]
MRSHAETESGPSNVRAALLTSTQRRSTLDSEDVIRVFVTTQNQMSGPPRPARSRLPLGVSLPLPPVARRVLGHPVVLVALVLTASSFLLSASGSIGLLPSSWTAPSSSSSSSSLSIDLDTTTLLPSPPLPDSYVRWFPSLSLPPSLLLPAHAPLASRLAALLARPVHAHDTGTALNHASCPSPETDQLVNPDQYDGEHAFWERLGEHDVRGRRSQVVGWLADRAASGYRVLGAEDMGGGRGVVLTGGNQDTTLRMLTLLRHLRRLGVDLPVEVFHYAGELTNRAHRDEIESLGGTIREVDGVHKVDGVWKNFQIKGLAIVQSSFRELLYLDSDNLPLRDPTHLFSAPAYVERGRAVFYPDLSKDHADNAIWRIVGEPCTLDDWTFESGQIVVDKAGNDGLNLAALWLAAHMQADMSFWFHLCGGDKDTFRWAWRMLDIEFARSPKWMSPLGFLNAHEGGRFCGHTMLQYDLVTPPGYTSPPPLFVHANLLKHLGGGLAKGQVFTHLKRFKRDAYAEPSLNYAHLWVYNGRGRGMCTDLEWNVGWEQNLPADVRDGQGVELVPLDELEGRPFDGFEDAFWELGGRVGGW